MCVVGMGVEGLYVWGDALCGAIYEGEEERGLGTRRSCWRYFGYGFFTNGTFSMGFGSWLLISRTGGIF